MPLALTFDRTALGLGFILIFNFLDRKDEAASGFFEAVEDEAPDWFFEESDKTPNRIVEEEDKVVVSLLGGEEEVAEETSGRYSGELVQVAKFVSFSRVIFFLEKNITPLKPTLIN